VEGRLGTDVEQSVMRTSTRHTAIRPLVVAAILAASVACGDERPEPSPPGSVATPQASVEPAATIGRISVVAAHGGWGDDIFEVPGGFAAFTRTVDAPSCPWPCADAGPDESYRYMESADGITWREAAPPVPGDGPFEHVAGGSEHWIWSNAERYEDRRAWRSSDYANWTEVDLRALGVLRSNVEQLHLARPVAIGSTTLVAWEVRGAAGRWGLLRVTPDGIESIATPWEIDAALAVIGGRFVAVRPSGSAEAPWKSPLQDAGVWESTDGRRWSYVGRPIGLPDLAARGSIQLVDSHTSGASPAFIAMIGRQARDLWGSDDGLTWRSLSWAPATVFPMDGAFVAVRTSGDPGFHASRDGQQWSPVEAPADALGSPRSARSYFDPYRVGPDWVGVPDSDEDAGPVTWLLRFELDS
jgi:hypothetical protein